MKKDNKTKVFSDKKKKFKINSKEPVDNDVKLILSDPRFAHVASDPRYRNISKKATKIQIDERFKDVLTKDSFNFKHTLDPRGRPRSFGTKQGLDKFYDLKSSEDEAEDETDDESETSDEEEEEEESDVDSSDNQLEKKSKPIDEEEKERNFLNSLMDPEKDVARGGTVYSDDSSDDDSSTTDEEDEYEKEFNDFEWGELDADAKWDVEGNEVEETNRFAVCDMDWDHVKAVDLFVLFSSFAPASGCLKKVTIYPSKFGKERMAEEEVSGPQELKKLSSLSMSGKSNDSFSNLDKIKKGILDENDEGSSLEFEALRRYQRNRLKYYYAVVECDSLETAKVIYKECDRSHFEDVGVTIDLRYIPSHMEFDEAPHDICEKTPASYERENLPATSISNAKPVLTWDETDRRRKKVLRNAMTKVSDKDKFDDNILEFVAGSESDDDEEKSSEEEDKESSDDEEGNDIVEGKSKGKGKHDRIAKFRSLISEIEEKEKKKRESTFTFEEEDAFAASHERDSDEENKESEDEEDEDSKEESEGEEFKNLTPFEKMLMKGEKRKKERKLKKKKKLQSIGESDSENDLDDSENSHIVKKSQKKTNKKKNKESEDVPEKSNDDLALLVMDEEQEDKKHFDMRKIREKKEKMQKKKRKRSNDDDNDIEQKNATDFEINTTDSRFSALFTNSEFSIDPSHPNFDKHSSAMQNIMQKQKKMKANSGFIIKNKSNNKNKSNDERNSKIDSDISAMLKNYRVKTSK